MHRMHTAAMLLLTVLVSAAFATGSNSPTETARGSTGEAPGFQVRLQNRAETGGADWVGEDSLYFKAQGVTDTFYGCPKSEAPNPTPANCRPPFTFLNGQTVVGMDPFGQYAYEVSGTTLRRHNTGDGTYNDYTITRGSSCCMTNGFYLYVPVDSIVCKYALGGATLNLTTLNITPLQHGFSVARDTVWCSVGAGQLYGYACSRFTGGRVTPDVTWDIGSGTGSGVLVAWDGQYYYAVWTGGAPNTFKRFNADRTLSDSGTIGIDARGLMCLAPYRVGIDSLYFKSYAGTALMSAGKSADPAPVSRLPMAFQNYSSVPCMDPAGNYIYEVTSSNLRRFSTATGAYSNFPLAYPSGYACATDGNYVFAPNGPNVNKYTMTGTHVSTTTLNITCDPSSFALANDTIWATPHRNSGLFYGYASTRFNGDTISEDQQWNVGPGTNGTGNIAWDDTYYYVTWSGVANATFKRFTAARVLHDSGLVHGVNPLSVMCRWTSNIAVAEPVGAPPPGAFLALAPNPLRSGFTTLRYSLTRTGPASITVCDVAGRPVYRRPVAPEMNGAVQLDLREVPAGVYLVRLEAGQQQAVRKLVVQD